VISCRSDDENALPAARIADRARTGHADRLSGGQW
jgi:hypothetical protein